MPRYKKFPKNYHYCIPNGDESHTFEPPKIHTQKQTMWGNTKVVGKRPPIKDTSFDLAIWGAIPMVIRSVG